MLTQEYARGSQKRYSAVISRLALSRITPSEFQPHSPQVLIHIITRRYNAEKFIYKASEILDKLQVRANGSRMPVGMLWCYCNQY